MSSEKTSYKELILKQIDRVNEANNLDSYAKAVTDLELLCKPLLDDIYHNERKRITAMYETRVKYIEETPTTELNIFSEQRFKIEAASELFRNTYQELISLLSRKGIFAL